MKIIPRRYFAAGMTLLLGACMHAPMQPSDTHIRATDSAPAGTPPAPVQMSPVVPKPKPILRPETYSVVVNNVKVQELLFALARDAKLNIDVHPGITGVVTLNAIDQTLPQLLSRIAKQVDMRWELDGPNLVIMPDSPYLRIYKVDYLNMERTSAGQVGVSSQISGSGAGGAGGGGGGAAAGANSSTTTVRNTSSNTFWKTLDNNIKDLLRETDKILPNTNTPAGPGAAAAAAQPAGAPPPGANPQAGGPGAGPATAAQANVSFREAASVIANPEAGVLAIRATSRQHEKIQEFLDQVMASAKRQVLIEATIAEVQLSNQYQQGIDWSILRKGTTGVNLTQTSTTAGLPSTPTFPNIFTISGALANYGNLTAAIQMLDSFGTVRVLSSPKLSVLNNQTAMLRVADNIVYFNVQVSLAPGNLNTNATTAINTSPVTVPVGFVMNVTPQISDNDTILLNVKPTTTRLLKYVNDPNPSLAAAGVANPVPQLRMRELESLIKVNSGEVAVLGGLIEDSINDVEDNIPGVGSVPVLNWLFNSRNRSNTKTEMVIFIRPVVVKDPGIDGDFSSLRGELPDSTFMSRPNPGRK